MKRGLTLIEVLLSITLLTSVLVIGTSWLGLTATFAGHQSHAGRLHWTIAAIEHLLADDTRQCSAARQVPFIDGDDLIVPTSPRSLIRYTVDQFDEQLHRIIVKDDIARSTRRLMSSVESVRPWIEAVPSGIANDESNESLMMVQVGIDLTLADESVLTVCVLMQREDA